MRQHLLTRRHVVQSGMAATGLTLIPASARVSAQDETEVVFWNSTLPFQDAADPDKPLDEFYVYQAIARFQEANPGVVIAIENLPGGPDLFTKYRTASVAQNGPDVMGLWSGTYMLQFKDFLEPMGPHYTAEERAVLTGWEAVNETFDPASPDIYGVPGGSDGMSAVFYNAPLLANAGIDPTTSWPTNIDEFLTMLQTVQDSGVTPLALDTYSLVWQVLLYWIGQTIGGAAGIGQLASGERNFSDPEVVNIISRWQEVAKYVIPGAETMEGPEAQQFFYAGETAMITGLFFSIETMREFLGDDLGMIPIPDFSADAPITGGGIGGPGVALIVSNYSQVKDAAISFVKFLMSEQELLNRANSGEGHLVNLANIDAAEIYDDPFMVQQQEWAVQPSTIFWPDNVLPAELTTEIKAQSELAWVGSIDAAEFAAAVDAKRDELLNG